MLSSNMLSCFVNASGLMGGSHLELVRGPVNINTLHIAKPKSPIPHGVSYIPSNPSHIGNAIQNVSRMLEEMKSIDWNGFATKINGSLDNLNALLNKQELDAALKRFERIGQSLETTAARLEKVVTQENINRINDALIKLNQSTDNLLKVSTSKKVEETINNLNTFLNASRQLISKTEKEAGRVHSEFSLFMHNIENALSRMENTLTGLNRQLQDLSRDPAQLLRGKGEPERN
ncbi:MAG: hypothetical protein IKC65_09255 [Lentisphaeria bacterium]|nr:hypothetical protein [Lentisphaeria bacterium]